MLHQQANNDANRNKEVEKSKVLKVGKLVAAAAFFSPVFTLSLL